MPSIRVNKVKRQLERFIDARPKHNTFIWVVETEDGYIGQIIGRNLRAKWTSVTYSSKEYLQREIKKMFPKIPVIWTEDPSQARIR